MSEKIKKVFHPGYYIKDYLDEIQMTQDEFAKRLGITGKQAETALDKIHITVNKNTIPNDTESPMKTSGIRLGTPAMTTRGFKEEEFIKVG